jgi:predicted nucleic-acid-binding protein
VKITADTNVIVRMITRDDPHQARIAAETLDAAERIALPIVTLCETIWLLRQGLRWTSADAARTLRVMLNDPRILADWDLIEAGLDLLEAGGDFADAVIAAEGRKLGAKRFVTFDRRAASRLEASGEPVLLLDAALGDR